MRTLAGLSQSELAGQADVPVRTIQQYEQRQKDINQAQAETLLRLARALNCNVEDLMEKVPPLNFIARQESSATSKQHSCDMQFNAVAVALKS